MRRAIVAFAVVVGMALMMAGCGQQEAPAKGGATGTTATAPSTATTPAAK
jgi:hypothetical protein